MIRSCSKRTYLAECSGRKQRTRYLERRKLNSRKLLQAPVQQNHHLLTVEESKEPSGSNVLERQALATTLAQFDSRDLVCTVRVRASAKDDAQWLGLDSLANSFSHCPEEPRSHR